MVTRIGRDTAVDEERGERRWPAWRKIGAVDLRIAFDAGLAILRDPREPRRQAARRS
jgi:hypothetical protein